MNAKKIYLVWDRKYNALWGVTTNHFKAIAKASELNSTERIERFKVFTQNDFAMLGA